MKKAIGNIRKRDLDSIGYGLRIATKTLFHWVNGTRDKEILKKRLLVVAGVPAGLFLVGTQYPALVSGLVVASLLACVSWFSYRKPQAVTVLPEDFVRPFLLEGRTVDIVELAAHLVREHPEDGPRQTADRVRDDFGGPDLTEKQMASFLSRHGLAPAVAAAEEEPAPRTEEEVAPEEDKPQFTEAELVPSPAQEERSGGEDDDAEHKPAEEEEGQSGQNRGSAQDMVL